MSLNEQKQIILKIGGMSCTGCEMRIENAVDRLDGVIRADASYIKSEVYVVYDGGKAELNEIIEAIEKQDYVVMNKGSLGGEGSFAAEDSLRRTGGKAAGKKDVPAAKPAKGRPNVGQMIGIGVIVLALYLIINNTIGFNFIPEINQSMGYGLLFAVGLLTSLHCVAMCGGINLSVCMRYRSDGKNGETGLSRLGPGILYNLGRVTSYTIIGGIVGALGSVVSFSGTAKGIVAMISGIFMVIMGLNMLDVFPFLRKLNPRLPKFLGRKVHSSGGKKGPFIVGLLNGLMPCGPLQAMQLYALGTGSFAGGALSMFLFSLGTVPLMFGFGAVSSLISGRFTHKMMKVSAVLVMVLGVFMLNRGMNLSGLGFVPVSAKSGQSSIAKVENGVQTVFIELDPGGYSPVVVQKGIPVKWTIRVEEGDLNGCNNPITIPQYNLNVRLKAGDNIIEFTPKDEGDIIYTCWMGMISSRIRVVPDIGSVSEEELKDAGDPDSYRIEIPTDKIAIGEIRDGVQYVSIDVKENEYSPAVVVLQDNVETVWTINGSELNDHNAQMIFPEYNTRLEVREGENAVRVMPEFDFTFRCWLGSMNGYVKIVEDINHINIDQIKEEVKDYQPPSGAGGALCH